MRDASSEIVGASELEQLLAELQASLPPAAVGVFGPDSVSWKINRESALFLGAGRAALLQLAHPWVAAALAEHSRTLHDPGGRFHQTFRVIFTMIFGTREQAFAASRGLHRRHQGIRGTLPDSAGRFKQGSSYEANEVDALRWVYATLVDSALLAYELVLPQLSDEERGRYYVESLRTAALFGIPHDCLPLDWPEFQGYMQTILASDTLSVSSTAKSMAQKLQAGAGLKVAPPLWYRGLTVELLPPRLREEFGLSNSDRAQRAANRALRLLRRVYPRLPTAVRFVGPYNEAEGRMSGRATPRTTVQLSNRMWIGRSSLLDM